MYTPCSELVQKEVYQVFAESDSKITRYMIIQNPKVHCPTISQSTLSNKISRHTIQQNPKVQGSTKSQIHDPTKSQGTWSNHPILLLTLSWSFKIVISKLLKCHSKAKHRAPACSQLLCQIRGVVQCPENS